MLVVYHFAVLSYGQPQESRTITQFHYFGWASNKCPEQATSLIDLIGDLLRVQRKSGNGPITVHCGYEWMHILMCVLSANMSLIFSITFLAL